MLHACRAAAAEAWEESIKTPYSPLPDPGVCADLHSECEVWAKQGECTKNPGYMIGNVDGRGMCRKVRHAWPWQDSGRVVNVLQPTSAVADEYVQMGGTRRNRSR